MAVGADDGSGNVGWGNAGGVVVGTITGGHDVVSVSRIA